MSSSDSSSKKTFSKKSKLKQALTVGIYGTPELKKDEKNRYLGEFRERVIKVLAFDQIHEEGTYDEIIDAMNHPKAKILKISRKVDLEYARDYINAARENGISFNTVHSDSYKGPIGLIVASDEAVEVNEIMVEPREKRLKKQGLPQNLIDAVGETICDDCFQLIEEKAPEEAYNYKRLGLIDKLMGKKCEPCEK